MSKAENVKIPSIHMNGSPAKGLQEALEQAYRSLGESLEKLHETAPHARDYYVQEPGAFVVAQDHYFASLNAIDTVRNELLAIFEGIDQQVSQRTRQAEPVAPVTPDQIQRATENIHAAHERRVEANIEKASAERLDILILEIQAQDETELDRAARRACRAIGLEQDIQDHEQWLRDVVGSRVFSDPHMIRVR